MNKKHIKPMKSLFGFPGKLSEISFITLLLAISLSSTTIYPKPEKKAVDETIYTVSKIDIIGNVRVDSDTILGLIFIKESMKLTEKQIQRKINLSSSKLYETRLFLFAEFHYQLLHSMEEKTVKITLSIGENVIFLDLMALEEGGFTRFKSISPKAPDFGFLVGDSNQALYFRFHSPFSLPANLSVTVAHHADTSGLDQGILYDTEAVSTRLTLEGNIAKNIKIKLPLNLRKNLKGDPLKGETSFDFAPGIALLLDYSYLTRVYKVGFDIFGESSYGTGAFPYTQFTTGVNLYFYPLRQSLLILRGRYRQLNSATPAGYLISNLNNPFQVRGDIKNHYFGTRSAVLNIEQWFNRIFSIPASISNIYFHFLAFVDIGSAGDRINPIDPATWNLSTGGAIVIEFSNPLNLSLQAGYGYELWQNTGGRFYVKLGYEFYKGKFYE